MLIQHGLVLDDHFQFREGSLLTAGEQIQEIRPGSDNRSDSTDIEDYDASGCYVIPGLIDIHTHGCAGRDFCDGQPAALPAMGRYLASQGVTSFSPASLCLPEDRLTAAFQQAKDYRMHPAQDEAMLVGIYMEGPFFSKEKKGAHAEEYIIQVDPALFDRLDEASGHLIKVVCIAPEIEGGLAFIAARKNSLTISIAHTSADYTIAAAAFDAGATLVTHLFNAMKPFGHREPGVPGAAFDKKAHVELIADGIHLHPSMIRAAFKLYDADHIVLVSDAMAACGMPDGHYLLGNLHVQVAGGAARLMDGTIAGSATCLMEAMRRAVGFGIPLTDAIKAASFNPAQVIGESSRIGSLAAGKQADLVLLNAQLQVVRVMLRGRWLDCCAQT